VGEREFIVNEAISCLGRSVDQVRALRERNHYAPAPESRVFNEWILVQQKDAHPFDSLCFYAYELSAAQIAAAEDHIHALGLMLLEGTATVAPFVLGRAAIEASGRAALLLDNGIPDRERAALAFAERLHELGELRKLMESQNSVNNSRVKEDIRGVDVQIRTIRGHAHDQGVAIPARPGFTHVVREVLTQDEERDSWGTRTARVYSALAHSVPDILVSQTIDHDDRVWDPFRVGLTDLRDSAAIDLVFSVLVSYARSVDLQIAAYGWPPSSWKRWLAHVRASLRKALAYTEN
jgi:hypothetical protein